MRRTVPFEGVSIVETVDRKSLREYTTLRLGGPARRFVVAETTEDLVTTVRGLDDAGEPVLLVGGGSNLVIGDDGFDGTVVRIATTGWSDDFRTVAAGQDWDAYVAAGGGGPRRAGVSFRHPGLCGCDPHPERRRVRV